MSQEQVIILLLKIGLVAGFVSLVTWLAVYHVLTRGGWRKNPVGLTLVIEAALVAGLFVPQILSLFFNLNRLDSHIAAWADVVLIGAVGPVMIWRSVVMIRLDRLGRFLGRHGDGGDPDGTG